MKVDLGSPPEIQRQAFPEMEPQKEYDAVIVGGIITVLIHLLIFCYLPEQMASTAQAKPVRPTYNVSFEGGQTVSLENLKMPKPLLEEVKPLEMQNFVQVNPDAPENKPDAKVNFGARDQQSAQPEPALVESTDRSPETKGIVMDQKDDKIVTGALAEAGETPPEAGIYSDARNQDETKAMGDHTDGTDLVLGSPAPTTPLPAPKALKAEAEKNDGLASYLDPGQGEQYTDKPDPDQPINLSLNPVTAQMVRGNRGNSDRDRMKQQAKPLPRPKLIPKTSPGPLRENPIGVSQTGVVAIDSNFSEYGDYQQRFVDAISMHWHGLNSAASKSYKEMRSHVCVEFTLKKDGSVSNVSVITSNADKLRTYFCEEAIKARAPYGEWPTDMISKLGDQQTLRFDFYYY